MEFDKTKVYTALKSDESLIGAKGYFADKIIDLRVLVKKESGIGIVKNINENGFEIGNYKYWNFFYLVEPAPTKPKYRPFKDCDELIKCYYDICYKKQMSPNPNNFINEWIELPTIWVKDLVGKARFMITCFGDGGVSLNGSSFMELDRLYNKYTFLDGSACGVEE